ncbi:MAG: hypothetical protein GY754_10915 [bacterium]|nr:hypothetical protein [bacterium]
MRIFYILIILFISCSAFGQDTDSTNEWDKGFVLGFDFGFGMGKTLVPQEYSTVVKAESKTGYLYDAGINVSYYFVSFLGLHSAVGYDYFPFYMNIPYSTTINSIPISVIGKLTGELHYLSLKFGSSFKISNFFINADVTFAFHLASSYRFQIDALQATISGKYKKQQAAAYGIIIEPGYRIKNDGYLLPISLAFTIMKTPIGETDMTQMLGIILPKTTLYTFNIKLRFGFQF